MKSILDTDTRQQQIFDETLAAKELFERWDHNIFSFFPANKKSEPAFLFIFGKTYSSQYKSWDGNAV